MSPVILSEVIMMQIKRPHAPALVTSVLVSTIIVSVVPTILSISKSGTSETEFRSHIIEAENAVGEWNTGFIESLGIIGAYITGSEDLPGAVSHIDFNVSVPGFYFIGYEAYTPHDIDLQEKMVSCFVSDLEGNFIRNQFEDDTIATSPTPLSGFWASILGLWNLPKGTFRLTFRGHATHFLAVDFFYLTPLIAVDSVPSILLPMTGYKPLGNWDVLESGAQTEKSGVSAWTVFHVPTAGKYTIYANMQHHGGCQHKINFNIEQSRESESVQVILKEDETAWKAVRLGSFSLEEGDVTIRFTTDPSNPSGCLVVIGDLFFFPESSMVLTEAPNLPERKGMWVDGLLNDWPENIFSVNDPTGDTARTTDFKTLKATIEDDFLWVAVEFYALVFLQGWDTHGRLGLDFDGDRHLDSWCHIPIAGRGGGYLNDFPTQPLEEAEGQTWDVIEMKIPLSVFGNRTEFYIYYSMWDYEEDLLIDSIGPLYVSR
jgi:hypothetical protein